MNPTRRTCPHFFTRQKMLDLLRHVFFPDFCKCGHYHKKIYCLGFIGVVLSNSSPLIFSWTDQRFKSAPSTISTLSFSRFLCRLSPVFFLQTFVNSDKWDLGPQLQSCQQRFAYHKVFFFNYRECDVKSFIETFGEVYTIFSNL